MRTRTEPSIICEGSFLSVRTYSRFCSGSLGSRSPGSCISRSLVLPPRILPITVIFCLTLVVVRGGLIPTTSGSCLCHEHTTNLATGVSRQPVLDCGTIFHFAADGTFLRFFQTIFENTPLWRLKRLVTLSTYRRYINECIYLSIVMIMWSLTPAVGDEAIVFSGASFGCPSVRPLSLNFA